MASVFGAGLEGLRRLRAQRHRRVTGRVALSLVTSWPLMYTSASSSWWIVRLISPAVGIASSVKVRRIQMSGESHLVPTTAPGVPRRAESARTRLASRRPQIRPEPSRLPASATCTATAAAATCEVGTSVWTSGGGRYSLRAASAARARSILLTSRS